MSWKVGLGIYRCVLVLRAIIHVPRLFFGLLLPIPHFSLLASENSLHLFFSSFTVAPPALRPPPPLLIDIDCGIKDLYKRGLGLSPGVS